MKISYNWLKDYVEIYQTPEKLANDLSLFGFMVESIKKIDDDFVLDLEINPNRGDCLSVLGIAREVAALYNLKLKTSAFAKATADKQKLDKDLKIQISNPDICSRYTVRIIDGVKIQPSPKWLQKHLVSYGFRPINNIVDITNFVMIATGQPLHAFDYDKIKDGKINIRLSKEGEELITLDGKNHKLPKNTIVIEDSDKIYDLAGIMGGLKSEIDEKTKTIVLQGAIFDPILIRRASKKLWHVTDASYRYERGVDPEGTKFGVNMATSLIKESCPDVKLGELIDIESQKRDEVRITLDNSKVNNLLGTKISEEEMVQYLKRLNFFKDQDQFIVPSYRIYDVKIWQDLAEEIARVFGYDKISKDKLALAKRAPLNEDWQKKEIIKDFFKNNGFSEVYSYSLIDKKQIELLGFNVLNCQEIANPLSWESQYLRPSLLPSLLTQISKNPWAPEIAVFEIGKVFYKEKESWQIGLAVVGNLEPKIKEMTKLEQKILDFYKIRRPVKVFIGNIEEINLSEKNITIEIPQNQYREISKYPPTVRDLAFIVDKNMQADIIWEAIKDISEKILFVELFDEFMSDKFGQNKKNLAFHIWLEDLKGPISEEETKKIMKNIIKTIESKFTAKLRR